MEIELKYEVKDKKNIEELRLDKELKNYFLKNSEESIEMSATYFDTVDNLLQKNFIALRLRREGHRNIATLKWNGTQEDSLHMREELNVNVGSGEFFDVLDVNVFKQSEIGEKVIGILGDKKLIPLMKVDVLRESWQMEKENNIFEFSFDRGNILTDKGSEEISELEIEIITGDEKKLLEVGKYLSEKYDLKPESRSKFKRGLSLLGKINN